MDLPKELPAERYSLSITKEAEFEIPLTPQPLRAFIEDSVIRWSIQTDLKFGWADERHSAGEQRFGGFNVGTFASTEVAAFYASQQWRLQGKQKKRSLLYKNEADIALGARAFEGVVLTLDRKRGPLKDAVKNGGKVVFLNSLPHQAGALRSAVEQMLLRMAA